MVCALIFPVGARADVSVVKGTVKAVLSADSVAVPLDMAGVSLLALGDSVPVRVVTTTPKGYFSITFDADPDRKYALKVSFTGMQPVTRTLALKTVTDVGTIVLRSGIQLGEIVVEAPHKDVELVGDTTVINVDAFKTSEGALLEELVRLIPGMEYDEEAGTITYNDETITEININGQTYDLGGAAAVLETIPVEILDKLKVYDKADEMEKFSGRRSRRGRKNMVLDLSTRQELGAMIVAKARVAQGTEHKKEYALEANRFKKQGDHINLMGQSGNLRARTPYPDNRSDRVNTGINLMVKKDFRIAAHVNYNHSINGSESSSGSERYLVTGTRWNYSDRENLNKNHSLGGSASLNWIISPKWFWKFSGNYNTSDGSSSSQSKQASFNQDPYLDFRNPFDSEQYDAVPSDKRLNDIRQQSVSGNNKHSASVSSDVMRTFNDKNTNLSLSLKYSRNESTAESFSLSRTTFYELRDIFGNDSVLLRNQYRLSPNRNYTAGSALKLSQRLNDKVNIDFNYGISLSRTRSYSNTYDLSPFFTRDMDAPASWLPDGFEAGYTDSLSNRSRSNSLIHDFQFTFNYFTEPVSVNFNFRVSPERRTLDQKTGRVSADTVRHSVNFTPDLHIALRPGKSQIDFSYRGNTDQPSLNDLLTLTDNSDPLNISRGNPDLSPSYTQNIELKFDNRDIGLNFNSRWSNTYNSIAQSTTYDLATGGVDTHPVNINGNWNSRNTLRYTYKLRNQFRFSTDNSIDLAQNVGLMNEGRQPEPSRSITRSRNLSSRLRITYSPKWGSMNLSGTWRHNFSKNRLRDTRNYVRSYAFAYDIFAKLPGSVQLRSDISYSFRNGTNIIPGEDDQWLWNLEASWRFLRKKAAEIKIEWRDILSNSKDFRRSVSATGVTETYSRVVGSYFLATFRYNFNFFNGMEQMRNSRRERSGDDRDFDRSRFDRREGGNRDGGGWGGGGNRGGWGGGRR